MKLTTFSIKFASAAETDDDQTAQLTIQFDGPLDYPPREVSAFVHIPNKPDLSLRQIKDITKAEALRQLEDAVKILKNNSVSDLERLVAEPTG